MTDERSQEARGSTLRRACETQVDHVGAWQEEEKREEGARGTERRGGAGAGSTTPCKNDHAGNGWKQGRVLKDPS